MKQALKFALLLVGIAFLISYLSKLKMVWETRPPRAKGLRPLEVAKFVWPISKVAEQPHDADLWESFDVGNAGVTPNDPNPDGPIAPPWYDWHGPQQGYN